MLNRLAGIKDFKQGRHLLTVSRGSRVGPVLCFETGPCGEKLVATVPHKSIGQLGAPGQCRPGSFPELSLPQAPPPPPLACSLALPAATGVTAASCCVSSHLWPRCLSFPTKLRSSVTRIIAFKIDCVGNPFRFFCRIWFGHSCSYLLRSRGPHVLHYSLFSAPEDMGTYVTVSVF